MGNKKMLILIIGISLVIIIFLCKRTSGSTTRPTNEEIRQANELATTSHLEIESLLQKWNNYSNTTLHQTPVKAKRLIRLELLTAIKTGEILYQVHTQYPQNPIKQIDILKEMSLGEAYIENANRIFSATYDCQVSQINNLPYVRCFIANNRTISYEILPEGRFLVVHDSYLAKREENKNLQNQIKQAKQISKLWGHLYNKENSNNLGSSEKIYYYISPNWLQWSKSAGAKE